MINTPTLTDKLGLNTPIDDTNLPTVISVESTPPLRPQIFAQKVVEELRVMGYPPETWDEQLSDDVFFEALERLGVFKTPEGMAQLVALLGSTHAAATWRDIFTYAEINTFNPVDTEWKNFFSKVEARIKKLAVVIGYRIENNGLGNGSMGSIAEMTMAMLLSYFYGNKIEISVEDGIEKSLTTPQALIQYFTFKYIAQNLPRLLGKTQAEWSRGSVNVKYGERKQEFKDRLAEAYQLPVRGQNMTDLFAQINAQRNVGGIRKVMIAGSGEKDPDHILNPDRKQLAEITSVLGTQTVITSEGDWGRGWDDLYEKADGYINSHNYTTDTELMAIQTQVFALLEKQFQMYEDQDEFIVMITKDQLSRGALTELPAIAMVALNRGIRINICIEDLDIPTIVKAQIDDVANLIQITAVNENAGLINPQMFRDYLIKNQVQTTYDKDKGVSPMALLIENEGSVATAATLLHNLLTQPDKFNQNWKAVKGDPILKVLTFVNEVDNSIRTRNLVVDDWKLAKAQFPGLNFFTSASELVAHVSGLFPRADMTDSKLIREVKDVIITSLQKRGNSTNLDEYTVTEMYNGILSTLAQNHLYADSSDVIGVITELSTPANPNDSIRADQVKILQMLKRKLEAV